LGYNRYNTLVSESSGLHLELLPMLVGFFTYKVAVVAKQGLELLDDIFDRNKDEV
jgi:ATP synthase protein I